ncbi:hypothetical protein G7Y89_g1723 [Cudoniella acicularis]|uniref:Uncharacterized protein n=1 Tax=Cudoniella acicularis TaxID=354080 RepID=A0A8H4WA03_9HELO|nr:hypothetical protein G7Y89_g1723 [Cudoniella acicularis]
MDGRQNPQSWGASPTLALDKLLSVYLDIGDGWRLRISVLMQPLQGPGWPSDVVDKRPVSPILSSYSDSPMSKSGAPSTIKIGAGLELQAASGVVCAPEWFFSGLADDLQGELTRDRPLTSPKILPLVGKNRSCSSQPQAPYPAEDTLSRPFNERNCRD